MGQRNMMVDIEMQQQSQGYVQTDPCIFLGSLSSFPQPNIPGMITGVGNVPNLDAHPLPEPYDTAMFYGIPQYHGVQHLLHHASNLDAGVPTAPNFYLPYMAFHALPSQFPSSSSHGAVGITFDEYERNAHLMDTTRGSYKRKNAEGASGNSHYLSSGSAPASFVPLNTNETGPFSSPPFRGRGRPGAASMDSVLSQGQNNFIQGNYAGQPFPLPGSVWFDQHQMSNNGRSDGSPLPWSQAPSVPFMPGGNVVSPLHPRHVYINHHPSPPPIQGVRGHNPTVYPHMALASYRNPANYDPQSTIHDASEMRAVQPTGFRIYQHHREDRVPEATLSRGLPHLRVMPVDEVALLEVGDLYESGNYIDNHRDLRLDIEDMSYEELLALSERIGTVNTGLSEEKIHKNLKIRTYLLNGINLEEAPSNDLETESCTICQDVYKNKEKIGSLECGHEYHAECLKKWLIVKNVCPICKSEALAM